MSRITIGLMLIMSLNITPIFAQFQANLTNDFTGDVYKGSIQYLLAKAENLLRQGDQIGAMTELDNAVNLAPQYPEVYLHRALLKYKLGMRSEAHEDAAIAARLNPIAPALFGIHGPQAQMDLLAFYPEELYQKISWSDRLAYYETTLDKWYEELNGSDVTDDFPELEATITHFEGALIALENKEWYKAIDELSYLALFQSNTSVFYDLKGLVHLEMEEVDKAATAFRQAINLDPNNAMAWFNLSKISQSYGDYATSLDFLNKAIGLVPTFHNAYFERALVKKKLGDIDGAIADYSKIIDKEGTDFLSAYFNRAICYKKIGQLTTALNDLDEVLFHRADNPMAWKARGNIHLLAGRHSQAIADFSKAIDLDSELGVAYFNRGIAHLLNHNPMTACVDFERSANEGYDRALDKQRYFCSN
ncbi:MAG: tetratricopeptide repeat protein [Saprospiraceae bacterium]